MNWLITGGTGFLGKYLLKTLKKDNIGSIVIYDIKREEEWASNDKIIWVKGNILDKDNLEEVIKKYKINGIVHLAYVLLSESNKSPYMAIKINCDGTLNVLDLLVKYDIQKMIWSSSVQVYGSEACYGKQKWVDESYVKRPESLYGMCKAFCEDICNFYRTKFNLNIVGLRFSTIVGSGRVSGSNTYLCELIKNAAIKFNKSQHLIMPYAEHLNNLIYVKDAAEAIKRCMKLDYYRNPIYNICSDVVYTNKDIANIIKNIFPDKKIDITSGTFGVRATPYTSPVLAKEQLGFLPLYTLKNLIEDFILERKKSID